jgi:ATP-binding cassette subfamily B protein
MSADDVDADENSPSTAPSRRVIAHLIAVVRLANRPRSIVAIVALSLTSSLVEAAALLLIAASASSVLTGDPVDADFGPVHMAVDVDVALMLAAVGAVTAAVARLITARVASRLTADLLHTVRVGLVRDLLHAPWSQQTSISPARLQELISSQAMLMAGLLSRLNGFLTSVIAFSVMAAAAVAVDPIGAVALVVVGIVLALAFRPLTTRVRQGGQRHLDETHRYVAVVSDIQGVLPEVRVYGVVDQADALHVDASTRAAEEHRRVRVMASLQPVLYMGSVLLLLIAGIFGLQLRESLDIAQAGALVLMLLRGLRYSQSSQSSWQGAVESISVVEDFDRMRSNLTGSRGARGGRRLERVGSIEFESVSYTYPAGETALRDVSLKIEPMAITGLAGPSGAGKTTLAHIVLGLRTPTSGRILVDGVQADEFDEGSWFQHFAYVPQHPVLLDTDVRENVRFMRAHISDADVSAALSRASMDNDLVSWAAGDRRRVGVAGSQVSGGQRQRIAIARALAGRPDVLVLDEPTSALDPAAELEIRRTLTALRGEVTVLLIAHRESTLEVCDVVIRMANGTVMSVEAAAGAHERFGHRGPERTDR